VLGYEKKVICGAAWFCDSKGRLLTYLHGLLLSDRAQLQQCSRNLLTHLNRGHGSFDVYIASFLVVSRTRGAGYFSPRSIRASRYFYRHGV